jgi:protease I
MSEIKRSKVLMFVDEQYEDLELWYPKIRLKEEDVEVIVAGSVKGRIFSGKHGYPCKADASFDEVKEEEFDGLIIPGGFAPDKLRRIPKVLQLTQQFHNEGKLIAHICHAGWIPVSAKIIKGYKCTSSPGIKDDLINAGAVWVNKPVVIDRNMISGQGPNDLPEFCKKIINYLSTQIFIKF